MVKENEMEEFDWIQLKADMDSITNAETMKEKFVRKFKENPFVPVGCFLTTCALSYGLWSFRKGNSATSQLMMRFRIAAQGFTVTALIVGIGLAAAKK